MAMNDTKAVLVIITAGNCGHCNTLKKKLPTIIPKIASEANVKVVEVPLTSMSSQIDTNKYPADLARYKKWYPSMILFSGSEWDTAMSNTGSTITLNGIILNGKIGANGNAVTDESKKMIDPGDAGKVIAWINQSKSSLPTSSQSNGGERRTVEVVPLVGNPTYGSPIVTQNTNTGNYLFTEPQKNVCNMKIYTKRD